MIEIFFCEIIHNSSESINSALFSIAKPLRSPRLVKIHSTMAGNTFKGFRALFVACICSKNDSFLSVLSKAAFLSFTFFLQIIDHVS